jgi:hypothetical protein
LADLVVAMGEGEAILAILIWLAIYVGIAGSAAFIANRKGRNGVAWFLICFFLIGLIGLIIVACLPSLIPDEARTIAPATPPYDVAKWNALVASDPEIAASAHRLSRHGEQYVRELAATVLANGKHNLAVLTQRLVDKARAEATALSDPARLDQIGRHVTTIFRTPRGPVAQLKDWRVLAQVEGAFMVFASAGDYRERYHDNDMWPELTSPEERRSFLAAAHAPLEQLNATIPA